MKALAQERHNAKMLEGNENPSIAKNLISFLIKCDTFQNKHRLTFGIQQIAINSVLLTSLINLFGLIDLLDFKLNKTTKIFSAAKNMGCILKCKRPAKTLRKVYLLQML